MKEEVWKIPIYTRCKNKVVHINALGRNNQVFLGKEIMVPLVFFFLRRSTDHQIIH